MFVLEAGNNSGRRKCIATPILRLEYLKISDCPGKRHKPFRKERFEEGRKLTAINYSTVAYANNNADPL